MGHFHRDLQCRCVWQNAQRHRQTMSVWFPALLCSFVSFRFAFVGAKKLKSKEYWDVLEFGWVIFTEGDVKGKQGKLPDALSWRWWSGQCHCSCRCSRWFTTVTAESLRWHHCANCCRAGRGVECDSVCEQCDWAGMRQRWRSDWETNGHISHSPLSDVAVLEGHFPVHNPSFCELKVTGMVDEVLEAMEISSEMPKMLFHKPFYIPIFGTGSDYLTGLALTQTIMWLYVLC